MKAILHIETGSRAGETTSLSSGQTRVIGSGAQVDVRLTDPNVATAHTALVADASGVKVVDLVGSTLRNGAALPLRQPVPLASHDELSIADVVVRVELLGVGPEDETSPLATGPRGPALPSDQFEVVRELGRGAMGVVYQAVRRADQQPVAVKVMLQSVPEGSEAHRRFVIEGRVGARVVSPYVVRVLDAQVQGDTAFIVMEWVQGPSAWEELLAGRISARDALRIGEHVARGLAAAAQQGVVHRDVKPDNVLLSPDGIAKLGDFGIAKDLDATMRSLTQSGIGLGTLAYMAPEAATQAKHVDTAADIYSLGATLFALLAGRPPFDIRVPEELVRILKEPPPSLTSLLPTCPPDLAQLVAQLLAKDPYQRPPRADRVAEALAQISARTFGSP